MEMSDYDPMWHWWEQLQERRQLSEGPTSPSAWSPRAGTYSPHYLPTTPPSPSPVPDPVTPLAQTGPSAVGSASFDIRSLLGSAKKDPSSPCRASTIAALPSPAPEMHVDSEEPVFADTRASAEAVDTPVRRVSIASSAPYTNSNSPFLAWSPSLCHSWQEDSSSGRTSCAAHSRCRTFLSSLLPASPLFLFRNSTNKVDP
jgi:hypothetical protein